MFYLYIYVCIVNIVCVLCYTALWILITHISHIMYVYRVSRTHTRLSVPVERRRWASSSGGTGIGGMSVYNIYVYKWCIICLYYSLLDYFLYVRTHIYTSIDYTTYMYVCSGITWGASRIIYRLYMSSTCNGSGIYIDRYYVMHICTNYYSLYTVYWIH